MAGSYLHKSLRQEIHHSRPGIFCGFGPIPCLIARILECMRRSGIDLCIDRLAIRLKSFFKLVNSSGCDHLIVGAKISQQRRTNRLDLGRIGRQLSVVHDASC